MNEISIVAPDLMRNRHFSALDRIGTSAYLLHCLLRANTVFDIRVLRVSELLA